MMKHKNSERGYVTAMTALMLIPLMIMAALAVDVGSWYAEASSVQTAADASALAAVPYLPDLNHVVASALDEARRNGYIDVDGHSQATFDTPTQYPQILVTLNGDSGVRVQIKSEASAQFGQVVMDSVIIERASSANFIRSVPMGNPTSQLGGGHLVDPSDKSNAFWLTAAGYCARQRDGTKGYGGFNNTGWGCGNGTTPGTAFHQGVTNSPWSLGPGGVNTWNVGGWGGFETGNPPANDRWYNGNGLRDDYFVAIELSPAIAGNQYRVEIYRPGICVPRHESLSTTVFVNGGPGVGIMSPRIRTRLYHPDQTLADRWDSVTAGNIRNDTYWGQHDCNGWYTIDTIGGSAAEVGTHYLSYGTEENTWEVALNTFALRVVPASDPTNPLCTDIAQTGVCPTISAVDALPIYISSRNEDTTPLLLPGDTIDLYLANIGEEHAGKKLIVTLHDAGEGMSYIQFLNPSGTAVDFDWESTLCADSITPAAPGGHCGTADDAGGLGSAALCGSPPCLDVSNGELQHNEAHVEIDIPAGYTCVPDCWWKVRYVPGAVAVNDVTQWGIAVTGDPIRLTD